jgi:cobalt-precorrin 5A hydrolase/precorrin-3B C17-methyltransferase
MAVTPVVMCLNRAGEKTAHRIAAALGVAVHGRAGRVDVADVLFPDALEHTRALFAAGTPVIGVCASGILIRAVAPLLADKTTEPPVLSVSDDGRIVVPLLGGHRGANRLARQIADALGGVAAVTTAGDVALGVSLDEPPAGYALANPQDAKTAMAALLSGEGARMEGEAVFDLPAGSAATITVTESPATGGPTHLVYHPRRFALGVGCARGASA